MPFSALASRLLEKITGETAASTVGFMPDNNVTTPVGEKISIGKRKAQDADFPRKIGRLAQW